MRPSNVSFFYRIRFETSRAVDGDTSETSKTLPHPVKADDIMVR